MNKKIFLFFFLFMGVFVMGIHSAYASTTLYLRSGSWDWNDPDAWSYSSGGPNDVGFIPSNLADVILDENSGPVNITSSASCLSLLAGGYASTLSQASGVNLNIGGIENAIPESYQALNFGGNMTYSADGTAVIAFVSNADTSSLTLGVNFNGFTVGSVEFNGNVQSPYIMYGDVVIGSGGHWTVQSYANFNSNSASITMTAPTSFNGGNQTYANLVLQGVTGSFPITGSNTFTDISDDDSVAHSLIFDAGGTTTVGTFSVSGSAGKVITLNSTSTATFALTYAGGGSISSDYLNIQHSVATPSSTWYAGTHSTNNQGVSTAGSGWTFTAPPPPTSSVSGTVWTNEGISLMGSGRTVSVSINGASFAGSTTTDSGGSYIISGLTMIAGDVLTLYLDGNTEKGVTVTVSPGGNLTGIDIYQNDLITRQNNSGSLNNTNLDTADNNADADISSIYSVSGGALTVAAGKSLFIPTSNTYAPGGNVSVGGNFTNNGTYTKGTETLTLTGTSTQTFKTNSSQLYALTINGSGGTYTPADATTVSNNLTISAGTLSLVGSAFTVMGTSSITGTISTATSATGTKTFTGAVTVNSGGTFNMSSQNPVVAFGAGITQSSSNLVNVGSSNSNTLIGNLAGAGTGGITFGGTLTISSGTTTNSYTGGTITVTGTLALTGNFAQANGSALSLGSTTPFSGSGTFSASTATNTVTYTAGTLTVKDPNGGTAHAYSNLTLSGTGTKTMTAITTTNNFTMSSSNITSGNVLTSIGGNLILSGTSALTTGANLTVTGTTTIGDGTTLTLGAFTFTATGDMTVGGGSTGTFTATSGTAVNILGNLSLNAGSTWAKMTSGNMVFKSGGSKTWTDSTSGQDLGAVKISVNSTNSTVTLATNAKATSMTIDASQTLSLSSFTLTLTGTGSSFAPTGTFTPSTGTITYAPASSSSVTVASTTYHHITLNSSSTTFTLGGAVTTDSGGNLTITAGTLDTDNTNHYAISVGGNWSNSGTFTARTGTVTLTGTGSQTLTSGGSSFYALTQNGSGGTYTTQDALAVSNNLIITAGTLQVAANNLTVTGTSSITGTLNDNSATGTNIFVGAVTINSGGIWTETNNPAFTFRGGLTENSSSGFTSGSGIYTFDTNAQTISGSQSFTITNLTNSITTGAGLTFSGAQPTVTALTQSSSAQLTFSGSMPTITTLTATASGNTVSYTNTSAGQTVIGTTYVNLTINKSGQTATLGNNTTASGTVTISAGTLDASSSNYTISAGVWSNSGTFTPRSGTLTLTNTTTFSDTTSFYNFTINGSGKTVTLGSALTATNNITITAGTLDVSASGCSSASCSITVAKNFSNSGTFTARTGTVTLNGTSQKVFGSTTFYNFTKDISSASSDTLMFENTKTQTGASGGTFTLKGASGKTLTLRSMDSSGTQSDGTYWQFTVNGSQLVTYVDVKDSDASGGTAIAQANSTDSGHNLNWAFNVAPSFTAGPSDGGALNSPVNVGSTVTFTATATDSNGDNYYLAICKTNSVTAVNSGAPTCGGGSWAVSSSTASGAQASVTYTTQASDSTTNAWYAFVCDSNSSSLCSSSSQGSASNGSPFETNHAPTFSAISNTSGYIKAGSTVTFTSTSSDADSDNVILYVCKANDFSAGACGAGGEWAHGSATSSNATAVYTVVSGDGDGSHTYYANIIDSYTFGSSSNSRSSTFTTDVTKPTTTDNYASDGVWVVANQTITLTPADATSGVASTKYCTDSANTCDPTTGTSYTTAVTISTEGTTYFRYESTDTAGNVQTTVSRTVKIDKTNPTVSAGLDSTKHTSFTQTATASDTTSGVDASTYQWAKISGPGTVTFGSATALSTTISANTDGAYVISFTAHDNAGNSSSSSFNLTWDATAPTTTDNYASNNIWVNVNQTITLTPADASSGVASTKYCLDTSNSCDPTTGTSYTTAVTISTEGTNYFRYESTDNAGNVQTTVSRTVKIDKTAPTVNAGIDQSKSASFTQDATASDATSGITSYLWAKVSGSGTITFGSATSEDTTVSASASDTYVISLTATDNAGNSASDTFSLVWTTITTSSPSTSAGNGGVSAAAGHAVNTLNSNGNTTLIAQLQNQIAMLTAQIQALLSQQSGGRYVFARYLGYGDHGDDVLHLQQLLTNSGFFPTTVLPNSKYGPTTFNAVKQFQIAHNIRATGNVGPLTLQALNSL